MKVSLFLDVSYVANGETCSARFLKETELDFRPMVGDLVIDEGVEDAEVTKVLLDMANGGCCAYLKGSDVEPKKLNSCIDTLANAGWHPFVRKRPELIN